MRHSQTISVQFVAKWDIEPIQGPQRSEVQWQTLVEPGEGEAVGGNFDFIYFTAIEPRDRTLVRIDRRP